MHADAASGGREDRSPDDALRRIEERVQQVRNLGPFKVHRHEDGRFRCELEKPLAELTPGEIRQVLATLESLAGALRSELEG